MTAVSETPVTPAVGVADAPTAIVAAEDMVLEELLVEDVSIDGMCGVY